jgi:hypothetical protein
VADRLWLMFRYDMSGFRGWLPNPDGTFRSERLAAAIAGAAWTLERRPVPGEPELPPDAWISFTAPG